MSDLDDLARAARGEYAPPPPQIADHLDTERVWFVTWNGLRYGPWSEKEVANHIAAMQIGMDSVVWQHGWTAWQPILQYFSLPPRAPSLMPRRPKSATPWGWLVLFGLLFFCCIVPGINRMINPAPRPAPSPPINSDVRPHLGSVVTLAQFEAVLQPDRIDYTPDERDGTINGADVYYSRASLKLLFTRSNYHRDDPSVYNLFGATDTSTGQAISGAEAQRRIRAMVGN